MSDFYETRDDLGNSSSGDNGWDQAADFGAPTVGATYDVSGESFSGVLSQENLAGNNSAKNPYGRFSGVLGQSGLAS